MINDPKTFIRLAAYVFYYDKYKKTISPETFLL